MTSLRRAATFGRIAFARIPSWVRQTTILVGIYAALMYVLTLWMPVWHDVDWKFFQRVSALQTPVLSPFITLIDVRSWDPHNITADRLADAAFLKALAASRQLPKGVILDTEFDPCQTQPCGAPAVSARATLDRGLDAAAGAGIKVYAIEEVQTDDSDRVTGLDAHDSEIYSHLAGAAHTHLIPGPASSWFYRVCYSLPLMNGVSQALWSMMWRVLRDFTGAFSTCDSEHVPIPLGPPLAVRPPTVYGITSSHPFPSGADFNDQYLIVGTLRYDPMQHPRPGPEMVAWALSDTLQGRLPKTSGAVSQAYYRAEPQNGRLLLLVPAFSAFAALAFAAWFFLLRRLQLRAVRPFLPWISAALALCTGVAVFAAFESWMLSQGEIQPQITLISLGMVISSALCGVRGNQIEWELRYAIDTSPAPEKHDYDVFISYAHDEGAWVFEHVYTPLRDARLSDGRPLSIFFDTSTIRFGTGWLDKMCLALDASRFIVPVYSEVYFRKPYCIEEIKRAYRKWIMAGGAQSRCVLPIMRGHAKVLQTVDPIQYESIDDNEHLVEEIIAEIISRLSGREAAQPKEDA